WFSARRKSSETMSRPSEGPALKVHSSVFKSRVKSKEECEMKIISTFIMATLLIASTASAQTKDTRKAEDRLKDAGVVMSEVLSMPDTIPHYVLDRTKCVVVVPSVRKAAFVVGASYGRGAMVCRTGEDFTGPWGAPSMMAVEGASFGFQIGAEATDFVFLIMNERGASSLLKSKVKLGGDVAA